MKNQNEFATISAGTYSSPLQSTQTESHRVLISSLFVTTQFIYCIDLFSVQSNCVGTNKGLT